MLASCSCARYLAAVAVAVALTVLPAASAQQPSPAQADLVITGATVITMDSDRRVLSPGAVAIRGTDIVAVGESDTVRAAHGGGRIMDLPGRIVMPGLVNTHTHAPMVLYRGLADDLALMEWLEQYIFPAEARTVAPDFVRAGARLAALEMIRSGTTTYADMYYFEEEIAAVTKAAGLRAVLGQTVIGVPAPDAKTPAEGLKRAAGFITAYADDALITPAVAPHSMYLLDEKTLLACRDLALRHRVPLLIHLAETRAETATARERHQATPVAFLERIGFWAPVTVAAHGVWVSEEDVAVLARRRVGVAHNPESNMKLASGTAPVPRYLASGVPVGLGTDGAASNNDLDMFEAVRQTALLHKLTSGDPRTMPASQALELATLGGARVLGLDRTTGSLEPGKRADVIVVDARHPRHTPLYDPVSHVVYVGRGDDVETTIVHGRILMEDRQVRSLDDAQVLRDARLMAERVRTAVQAARPSR